MTSDHPAERSVEQRLHDAPRLLDTILAGELAGVFAHGLAQQPLVGLGRFSQRLREDQ